MYAFDEMRTDLLYFWNFIFLEFFERYTAVDAKALWPTKPISSKVPYYLFFFFSSSTSCYEYCVARGNTWIIAA